MKSSFTVFAVACGAVVGAFALASPAAAVPTIASQRDVRPSAIVAKVHDRWHEDDDAWHEHRRRRHYVPDYTDYDDNSDAYYSTYRRHYRRPVVVDAPFAHVDVGRHGRHIVAPFVDIWIPR
jgi:hypothetical protein